MKKRLLLLVIAGSALVLLSGCAANKKTHERGWIGGDYLESNPSFLQKMTANYFEGDGEVVPALPGPIKEKQSGAVLVSRVYGDTPLMRAGIREGDLIIAVDDRQVEDMKDFREIVDRSRPGSQIALRIYRAGEMRTIPVVVGRETFQKWGYVNLGLRLGSELDPVPTPDFDLFGLVSFESNDQRLELNSPEYRYYRQAMDLPPDTSDRTPESLADTEGWEAWFVIFGFAGKKIILSQESL